MVGSKNVFWQALLSAALIFGAGLLIGFYIEGYRTGKIEQSLLNSEINVLDIQLAGEVKENFDINCSVLIKNLFDFADKTYNEALLLENYDESAELTNTLEVMHRRYDLLRVMLWMEAIKTKKSCAGKFHTVAYIYDYDDTDAITKSEQIAFSRMLEEAKNKHEDKMLLIPMAGDLGLMSLDEIQEDYSIEKYPAVIVDEKKIIYDVDGLLNLDTYLAAQ